MKLSDIETKRIPPTSFVTVTPGMFADTWESKPKTDVVFGLRTLSEADKRAVRGRAIGQLKPNDVQPETTYRDALMRLYVARGVCDPNDLTEPPELLPCADDDVFSALTESGARFIFDTLLKLEVERLVTHPEASDDDVIELIGMLAEHGLELLNEEQSSAARRHLRFALDIIREAIDQELGEEQAVDILMPDVPAQPDADY